MYIVLIFVKSKNMMSYSDWMKQQSSKHIKIVNKLVQQNYSKEKIIDYFDFDNMTQHEHDFCELYASNTKCHDIEKLNCYLCACPYFRYSDSGIKRLHIEDIEVTQYSTCNIYHKDGEAVQYENSIHQDCSNCIVPHKTVFIHKNFSLSFDKIMKSCLQ